ncbi:MAG: hypothetical protein WCP59_16065, partial [Actinomycetota bacterium]
MATYTPGSRRTPAKQAAKPAAKPAAKGGRSAAAAPAPSGSRIEFVGLGLIVAGVLLGLAIYFDVAGPLGRGVETMLGWFTGIGRYVVPVALVGVGAALVHRGRSDNPRRMLVGWALVAAAVLGLLHVVRGP